MVWTDAARLLDGLEEADLARSLLRSHLTTRQLGRWASYCLDEVEPAPGSEHALYRARAHVRALVERLSAEEAQQARPARPVGLLGRFREWGRPLKGWANKW